jgi:N-methylhydantoinase A
MDRMTWRIGVDIGGTFTDVALVEETSGRIGVAKVPTTPEDLAAGVLGALTSAMRRYEVPPSEVSLLSHATTVVTNAILAESGARAALITTRGFRDVLELRRSARADLYDLFQDAPSTLIPRRRRFEMTERVGADGAIVTPLAENEIEGLIVALKSARVDAIAVAFLFSFLNPAHERALGAALRAALPDMPVYLSSDVLPEIKEFERTSTTAVCAYVGPILASYLDRLGEATRARALPPLYLMGSNGGILEAAEVVAMPAMAVESGPAAGVVAAALVARQTGRLDLLSFDMGGTTAKASLIRGGRYETTPDYEVGGGSSMTRCMNGTGHPIRVPVIDLAEVSAGGGSIAWVDRAGALRVGPKSAGANPGPACYGRGGTEPTVTDCDLLLGYLDKRSLLDGELAIDLAAAEAAVRRSLAEPLGVDLRTAAAAVIDVVNHAMAEVLKIVSVQRGHDPRDFVLAAFGGAGPLHAAALADELGIAEVICPPIPGAFSALGLVGTDLRRDYVQTLFTLADNAALASEASGQRGNFISARAGHSPEAGSSARTDPATLEAAFVALERKGAAMLDRAGVAPERRRYERSVDARYRRQSFELQVAVPPRPVDRAILQQIAATFHDRHLHTYGHDNRDEPVQIAGVRLAAIGAIPPLLVRDQTAPAGTDSIKAKRQLWFRETGSVDATIYDRRRMPAGLEVEGPVVIESLESTILVPPAWRARMNEDGFVLLRRHANGKC